MNMSENMKANEMEQLPSLTEFEKMPTNEVQVFARDKSAVLALGGTSRWYFLEHADVSDGYDHPERFRHYGRLVMRRIAELADMMFADGISTVFVVGFVGKQGARTEEYNHNMTWAYEMLADQPSQELYSQYQMGVLFRGGWQGLFEDLGAPDLMEQFRHLEQQTAKQRERWLVWFVRDDLVPSSLMPLVTDCLKETGKLPERSVLSEAYYGRPLDTVDIFISNNKLSIKEMCPPLMTLSDLYFTVSPTLYMDHRQWRGILYDHLFARRGHYREFDKLGYDGIEDMRTFYEANRSVTTGVGTYHALTQTWRPSTPR